MAQTRADRYGWWRLPAASLLLVAGLLVAEPTAASARPADPPKPQQWSTVHGAPAAVVPLRRPAEGPATPWKAPALAWPAAGGGVADLDAAAQASSDALKPDGRIVTYATPSDVRVGQLPVRVAKAGTTGPSRVRVDLVDRTAAQRAGVNGMLLTVRPADASAGSGPVRVSVDTAAIAGAFGGDWASRLRLVTLPSCAVTTPTVAACQVQTPLATSKAVGLTSLTAQLAVPAATSAGPGQSVLAVTSGAAGNSGDYSATPLKPSGSWTAGGSSGDFSYSYPITVPPVAGDLAPAVGLGYSSQSVDGEQVATNNQSSAIGDGWNVSGAGSVERSFLPCSDDPAGTAPKTADSCWAGNTVRVSFGAGSGDLVSDPAVPTGWKIANDSGARVELLTGADNGTAAGDYWKITTQDGTQYFFGLNKLPGYGSGSQATNAAWTEPVYAAHPGEPCYNATGFGASSCRQAWRWNLDYVVDTHHNALAYFYGTESNAYAANNAGTAVASYIRGGWLDHIDYGLRDPNPYGGHAPARVSFTVAERCLDTAAVCAPGNIGGNAAKWADTPYDLNCAAGAACTNHSPTFWSRLRVTGITTQIYDGAGYPTVDSYALTHSFPDPGDGTTPALWLASIQHTGGAGANASTLPAVSFAMTRLANRVDGIDGAPAMNHPRISTITTETGEIIALNYKTECAAPVNLDPANNTTLCYPVYWTQDGHSTPTLDWFHKYVVTEVDDQDPTGKAPPVTTTYDYLGGATWHIDDNELTKAKYRTYGQWRGYGRVQTRTGAATDARTLAETIFYRGMDGDTLPGGGRRGATVALSGALTVPGAAATVPDVNELAGSVREQIAYNGDGGPVDHATVTDYWVSPPQATRNRTGLPPLTATMTRSVGSRTTSAITATNPTSWRTTQVETTYDTTTGLPTVVFNHGDIDQPSQATCTVTSYAPPNTTANLVNLPAEVETDARPCGGSGVNGLTAPTTLNRPDDVIANTRTIYDTPSFATTWPQATPTVGDASVTQQARDYTGGGFGYVTKSKTLYDGYGRPTQATDANDTTATTAYTMTNGLTTAVTATNPLNQAIVTTLEPTRGLTVKAVDANGLETAESYDGLGRLTSVWRPGRDRTLGGNVTFEYLISQTQPSAVTTRTINENGSYRTAVVLYDALGRARQTQTQPPVQGRILTDTFYDTRGWAFKANNAYYDTSSGPSTTMLDMVGRDQQIPNEDLTTFDGLGRATLVVSQAKGVPQWQTRTIYGGDRTTVLPPAGGTPRTTIVDGLGRSTELDSYSVAPTVDGARVSGGSPVKTTYGYDQRGNQATVTDDQGNTWTSTYDLLGRVVAQTDPDAGTSTMTYDNNGNVLTSTDARANTITNRYDPVGRMIARYDGAGTSAPPLATWTYDSSQIANGIGRLAASTSYDHGDAYTTTVSGYDTFGSPLATTIVVPVTVANAGLAGSYTFTNRYSTTNGLLYRTAVPRAGGLPAESVNRTYTITDLPSGVGGIGDYIDSSTYNPFGQVSQTKLGFGVTDAGWVSNIFDEHTNQLARTYVDRTGTGVTHLDDVTYTYNPAGQITATTDSRNGGAAAETQCFRYDLLGRLSTAWTGTDQCAADLSAPGAGNGTVGGIAPYWTSWTYNTLGDRTGQTQHAVPGTTGDTVTTYAYPSAGAAQPHTVRSALTTGPAGTVTSTFGYDAAGNTTARSTPEHGAQTLTWNSQNKLAAVSSGATSNATYVYDVDGSTLMQRNPSANTATLFLPGEELTVNTGTNVVSGKRYYVGPAGTTCVRTGMAAGDYGYLVADRNGTATMSLDHSVSSPVWRSSTPFGSPRGPQPGTWLDTHGYLGKPMDATTGLTILGARQYDPDLGRFASVDPVFESADPNQLGGYTYAGNDPVSDSDPSGLSATCPDGDCRGALHPIPTDGGSGPGGNPVAGHAHYFNSGVHITNSSRFSAPKLLSAYTITAATRGNGGTTAASLLRGSHSDTDAWVVNGVTYDRQHLLDQINGFGGRQQDPQLCETGCMFNSVLFPDGAYACGDSPDKAICNQAVMTGEEVGWLTLLESGRVGGCMDSFDPATPIVMADGTTKQINDVATGDKVQATDPTKGTTTAESVTQLHDNVDTQLADITINEPNGQPATIHTTQHHLFWDATTQRWTQAAQLRPGDLLYTTTTHTIQVTTVRAFTGTHRMLNLTIANTHTYYVLAGNTPVLVHNCGGGFKAGIGADEVNDINRSFGGQTTLNGSFDNTMINASRYNSFYDKSAVVIRDIAGGHMFDNGNKRTAQAVVEQLMQRNNVVSGPTSAELRGVIDSVGKGKLSSVEDISRALRGY